MSEARPQPTGSPVADGAPAAVDPALQASPRQAVLQAQALGKRYDIYPNDRSRLLEFFGRRRYHQEHWAVRHVDIEVLQGRSVGVIGQNGAGKSTLLRLLAGITEPTEGRVVVHEPTSALLDLGLGFHANFTGRQNIFLNLSLLGKDKAWIEARVPEIIAFAELGDFIDYPVRTYSAGMSLRLGFATTAHLDARVLLVDEVLAVGDQYFQRKCVDHIEAFVEAGGTIVLVSHDLHAIRSVCQEAIWMERGSVRVRGPAREVVEQYLDVDRERQGQTVGRRRRGTSPVVHDGAEANVTHADYRSTVHDPGLKQVVLEACEVPDAAVLWEEAIETLPYEHYDGDKPVVIGSGETRVLAVQILDGRGQARTRFRTGETLVVAVTFRTTRPVERPIMGAAIFRNDGTYVYGPNTRFDGVYDGTFHGIYTFFLHYPRLDLLAGRYRLSIAIFDKHHLKPHVWHNQLYDFEVTQHVEDHGLVRLEHAWGLITHYEAKEADVKREG